MHKAYFYCSPGGLMYRCWKPKKSDNKEEEIHQLVIPQLYRFTIMANAHYHAMSGHLGVHKTRERILEQFYWPNIFKEVREFVASCQVCQLAARMPGRNVPMKTQPVLSETFTKVAMDIIGPMAPSDSGKKYRRFSLGAGFFGWVVIVMRQQAGFMSLF